jgi:hypothetical protein
MFVGQGTVVSDIPATSIETRKRETMLYVATTVALSTRRF